MFRQAKAERIYHLLNYTIKNVKGSSSGQREMIFDLKKIYDTQRRISNVVNM